jgi:hypothetical protein
MLEMQQSPGAIPDELARKIGAVDRYASVDEAPLPETMLDWAIRWAERGLYVFPCKSFLGSPVTQKWYELATHKVSQLVEWWSETPDADVAAVPERSGHFVLAAVGRHGLASLSDLEMTYGTLSPLLTTETRWGGLHLWFKGRALTSHELLGRGLHVYGPGTFVYMPASLAPDPE